MNWFRKCVKYLFRVDGMVAETPMPVAETLMPLAETPMVRSSKHGWAGRQNLDRAGMLL